MHSPIPRKRSLPAVSAVLFAAMATSQAPTPPEADAARPLAPATTPVPDTVRHALFVSPSPDGTVWARGADWKAAFTAQGMQFVPFLGSDAPRNFPLALRLAGASIGGVQLPLELQQRPTVNGRRIEIARGACVEAYDLAVTQLEQTFTFAQPVGSGALQVRMQIASELLASSDGTGGFRFANARGGVHYGRATAIDAASRSVAVAATCDGEWLTLTVPADFVATAAFPLTIDPVVQTFLLQPGTGTPAMLNGDCAYVGTFNGLYATVHEEAYSQTDHDVFAIGRDRDGNVLATAYVDYTGDYWQTPAIASHRGASQFLVVATKGLPTSNTRIIWGQTLTWNGGTVLTQSVQFPLHQFYYGKNPDVGGDANPSPSAPTGYCVSWEGEGIYAGELYYNLVRTDASLWSTNGLWLDPGTEFVSNPSISKSCGLGAYSQQEWWIVWQKRYSPTDEDIHASRIAVDGVVRQLDLLVDYSGLNDTNPEVSSPTDMTGAGVERFAVVYQRDIPPIGVIAPGHTDIMGQLFNGTTPVSGTVNLTSLLGGSIFDNHYDPCIDTDGQRFALGFTEWGTIFSGNSEPYLATLHVINDTFEVTALPELVSTFSSADDTVKVTSERSGGTFTPRYMATWQTSFGNSGNVHAAFYYGHVALGPTSYFNNSLPGCGPMTLTPSGLPALAQAFQLQLTGSQGIPFLLFGDWLFTPVNVCPACILGVDVNTAITLQTTNVSVFVPPNPNLIAVQFGAQGLDLLAPNACASPLPFALSNMLLITVL